MDKIDLDAIINMEVVSPQRNSFTATRTNLHNLMKEAINQALVLASENAKVDEQYDGMHSHPIVDKQSILDVDKLIV